MSMRYLKFFPLIMKTIVFVAQNKYIAQLCEFESPRVHTRAYKFVGTFSCAQIDLRKAREREI